MSHPKRWKAMRRSKRSEEHTSELQSQSNLVCRLLLEKKKTISVTPLFFFSRLKEAFEIAHGTLLSSSPAMISMGPRFGFLASTFSSVSRYRFADVACT